MRQAREACYALRAFIEKDPRWTRIIAERSGGMDANEFKREALHMFGGKRQTRGVGSRLEPL